MKVKSKTREELVIEVDIINDTQRKEIQVFLEETLRFQVISKETEKTLRVICEVKSRHQRKAVLNLVKAIDYLVY